MENMTENYILTLQLVCKHRQDETSNRLPAY